MMGWWSRRERAPLYGQICEPEILTRAWRHVRRGGGAGIDGQTVAAFEARWAENMAELAADLRERRYHPLPLKPYLLARPDGGQRPISLLTQRDRLVQRAVLDVVQPLFEQAAAPAAFGALPGRGVGDAIARAERARHDGHPWIVRADVRAFFEEVDHRRVAERFRTVTGDDVLTGVVEEWLAIGVLQRPLPPALPLRPSDPATPILSVDLVARATQGLALVRQIEAAVRDDLAGFELARPAILGLAGWLGANAMRWQPRAGQVAPLALGAGVLAAAGLVVRSRRQRGSSQARYCWRILPAPR